MKALLKNLGIIIVLLGVAVLAAYFFGKQMNALLVTGLGLQVAGVLTYILVNKKLD